MFSKASSDREKVNRARATDDIALELQYRFLKFVLKSEHLHYGLFEPDIPVDVANLKRAQERYVQRLIELIPAGTHTILDVGCGSGKMAELLLDRGYAVDCVSPAGALTDIAVERLGERVTIYRGRYEEVAIPKRYDLVLFSESYQYVRPPGEGLHKSISLLNPGGHILICDFFNNRAQGRSALRGGHPYHDWCAYYPTQPVDLVVERDITDATAPLHDIIQAFTQEVARPMWYKSQRAFAIRWPLGSRIVRFALRRLTRQVEERRLSTGRNGDTFRRDKVYKTYLFKLRSDAPAPLSSS